MSDCDDSAPSALLALAALHTRHAVLITSADDRIQWVNQGFTDLTGWKLSEIVGKTPGSLLNGPETSPEVVQQFKNGVERGERISTTSLCYGKDGQSFWLKVEKEPVYSEQGRLEYFISIETDVTRYVQQEVMLDKSERRLRDAIEALGDGFAYYDAEDRLVICNERYKEIYSLSASHIYEGVKFEDLLRVGLDRGQYLDGLDDPEAWLQERLAAHRNATGETTEQLLDDGTWLHIKESHTRDGGVVGIRRDVTDLKEAQLAAEQAQARAEAANKAKSTFLATMSHELRTPMSSILGLIELLQFTDLDETQRKHIDDIKTTSESLLVLLNDILDLSKIEAGHVGLENQAFSPVELAHRIQSLFLPNAQSKGLRLYLDIDDNIPDLVRGDPARLRQILTNLVGNALKFTLEGSVSICLRRQERFLIYEVQDSGIGIAADRLPDIFDPFVQGDSSVSRLYGGTGLGLAICKRLADAMGGTICVDSTPGIGSSFRIEIPFSPEKPETAVKPAIEQKPPPRTTSIKSPLRFLVAEDVALNRAIVVSILERHGHIAETVENGREAVDKLRNGKFDLVLMDIRMPVMDGLTATRLIRSEEKNGAHIPVIAITADVLDVQRDEILAAGIDAVITKPIDWEKLHNTISGLLI
ncbi:ATP-binding protein [Aestuariispira ectoiniformans]|uniref:ATP-binding protein n=1 Tax=Aestuariispira ectoiniformans TaxID=2775080 RepID=UPI00223AAE9F|nr:ATP-binding protein [Aestuariispira ectoiniformans]